MAGLVALDYGGHTNKSKPNKPFEFVALAVFTAAFDSHYLT